MNWQDYATAKEKRIIERCDRLGTKSQQAFIEKRAIRNRCTQRMLRALRSA